MHFITHLSVLPLVFLVTAVTAIPISQPHSTDVPVSSTKLAQKGSTDNLQPVGLMFPFQLKGGVPVITLKVGNPPQEVEVILDTGSFDIMLPGAPATSPLFPSVSPYHVANSATWAAMNRTETISYASAEGCKMDLGSEVIDFGNGIKLQGTVGVDTSGTCSQLAFGVLGLGKKSWILRIIEQHSAKLGLETIMSFSFQQSAGNPKDNWF